MTTSMHTLTSPIPEHAHPAGRRAGQPVLSKRGQVVVDDSARFIREALEDIRAYIHEHDFNTTGPPFAICTPAPEQGLVDVEAGWPLDRIVPGAGAIHSATLPPTEVRPNVHEAIPG
jgi:hypothetical protein